MRESGEWMRELFAALDRGGVPAMFPWLADDLRFRFGSYPPGRGRQAFAEAWAGMSTRIRAMAHEVLESWEAGDTAICRGNVRYTLDDDRVVTLPFANVFKLRGGLIAEYLVYVDASPVLGASAPPPAD